MAPGTGTSLQVTCDSYHLSEYYRLQSWHQRATCLVAPFLRLYFAVASAMNPVGVRGSQRRSSNTRTSCSVHATMDIEALDCLRGLEDHGYIGAMDINEMMNHIPRTWETGISYIRHDKHVRNLVDGSVQLQAPSQVPYAG